MTRHKLGILLSGRGSNFMAIADNVASGKIPNAEIAAVISNRADAPGLEAQRQALEHGVKFTGCTVHFVDENLDAGPVILQAVVPILDDDTVDSLAARILKEEHRIYSEAVKLVFSGNWKIAGRRVLHTS